AAPSASVAIGYPYGPIILAPAVALFTAGTREPVRRSLPAAVAVVAVLIVPQVPGLIGSGLGAGVPALVAWHGWLLVPWAAGAGMRVRRDTIRRGREEE